MKPHSARKHAKLAPSAAHRWIMCPGSIRESEGIESKSSVFADEGTAAHTLSEWCLRGGFDAVKFAGWFVDVNTGNVGKNLEGDRVFEVTDEMVDAVQVYLDLVRSLIEPGDEVEYEAKLDLSHIPGMDSGTGDCVIYKPAKRHLIIADLKYGRGVAVEAEDNPQTRAYALGASQRFHNRGVDWVESIICQPRCPHPEGVVRRELIEGVDLVEFRLELENAARATMQPDAPLNPGEWCRFCPAAPKCKALRGMIEATAQMEFSDEPPVVNDMTPDQMAEVLAKSTIIRDWVKRVEERAHQMAKDGNPPTGWKLVFSRATRKWKDEAATQRYLAGVLDLTEDQIFAEPKLRSPAQIEKVLGAKRKAEIADLFTSKASGTLLVPVDDPRPPAKVDAESEFGEAA